MFGPEEGGSLRLVGAHHRGVGRIDVHLAGLLQIPGDDGPHKEVDVFESVDQPGCVVQIERGCGPERPVVVVEHQDGGARRTEVNLAVGQLDAPVLVETVPDPGLGSHLFDYPLHDGPRIVEPSLFVQMAPGSGHRLHELRDRVTHPYLFDEAQRRARRPSACPIR